VSRRSDAAVVVPLCDDNLRIGRYAHNHNVRGNVPPEGCYTGFSIRQDSDLPFPVITRLVILPLFLFSGTFFPISQLPRGLRVFAVISPLWHGVSLARDATTGSFHVLADVGHVVALIVFILIGAYFGVRNFGRRLCA
jgi:hypothetical protein